MTDKYELPQNGVPVSGAWAIPKPLMLLSADDLKKVAGGIVATTQRENTMFISGNYR